MMFDKRKLGRSRKKKARQPYKPKMIRQLQGVQVVDSRDYIAYSNVLPPVPFWVFKGILQIFKEARIRLELTRAQLGDMIGASEAEVAAIEEFHKFPCDHRLERLIEVLCVKIVTDIEGIEEACLSSEKGDTLIICDPALMPGGGPGLLDCWT